MAVTNGLLIIGSSAALVALSATDEAAEWPRATWGLLQLSPPAAAFLGASFIGDALLFSSGNRAHIASRFEAMRASWEAMATPRLMGS